LDLIGWGENPRESYIWKLFDASFLFSFLPLFSLFSFNQRERDRERAQARNPKNDGLTPEQRRERLCFLNLPKLSHISI